MLFIRGLPLILSFSAFSFWLFRFLFSVRNFNFKLNQFYSTAHMIQNNWIKTREKKKRIHIIRGRKRFAASSIHTYIHHFLCIPSLISFSFFFSPPSNHLSTPVCVTRAAFFIYFGLHRIGSHLPRRHLFSYSFSDAFIHLLNHFKMQLKVFKH